MIVVGQWGLMSLAQMKLTMRVKVAQRKKQREVMKMKWDSQRMALGYSATILFAVYRVVSVNHPNSKSIGKAKEWDEVMT